MYLNIINNIKHESKKKIKNYYHTPEHKKDHNEDELSEINNDIMDYYSVFYGDLTKNWIKLKH